MLQELEARIRLDASAARQEILQMCEGMKRITLPVSTNADVSQQSGICQLQASHALLCLTPCLCAQVIHQHHGGTTPQQNQHLVPQSRHVSLQCLTRLCKWRLPACTVHAELDMISALQLKASTDFLRQAHPLKHVAPVRKSQVQHALCEVLAAMLADNVKADLPRYSLYCSTPPRPRNPIKPCMSALYIPCV